MGSLFLQIQSDENALFKAVKFPKILKCPIESLIKQGLYFHF